MLDRCAFVPRNRPVGDCETRTPPGCPGGGWGFFRRWALDRGEGLSLPPGQSTCSRHRKNTANSRALVTAGVVRNCSPATLIFAVQLCVGYIDTPGLADESRRKEAAEEIKKGLTQTGLPLSPLLLQHHPSIFLLKKHPVGRERNSANSRWSSRLKFFWLIPP